MPKFDSNQWYKRILILGSFICLKLIFVNIKLIILHCRFLQCSHGWHPTDSILNHWISNFCANFSKASIWRNFNFSTFYLFKGLSPRMFNWKCYSPHCWNGRLTNGQVLMFWISKFITFVQNLLKLLSLNTSKYMVVSWSKAPVTQISN